MKRYCAIFSVLMMLLQAFLILVSWIVSAVVPSSGIHSLISAGGIRWLVGSFTDNISLPVLVYIVLGAISATAFVNSGLPSVFRKSTVLSMQQKFALRVMVIEFLLFVVCMVYLTAIPHAVLLSVTGDIYPSSFSDGLIPLICFEIFVLSLIYGIFGGGITTISQFWNCVTKGSDKLLAVLFVYILIVQFYSSFVFVLGI